MSIDNRYVTSVDLNPYLVDQTTGEPLANGTISFYQDSSRSTPKAVYELTGSPPDYTYTALPNPVTLSATGTIADGTGNNVALYYFPYESQEPGADIQLYYVVVADSNGNTQFTREAWPNVSAEDDPSINQNNVIVNQLSNPQFAQVLFEPQNGMTLTYSGTGTATVAIAPDWDLFISYTGACTVNVARTAIAGSAQYPTNAPYKMSFTSSANVASLQLIQTLPNNPDIWSPASGGDNGYIGANITLDAGSGVTMYYAPSVGTQQEILSASNTSGAPEEFSNSVQLAAASNTANGDTGFVQIVIDLAVSGVTTLTSVQVVGLENEATGVDFNQATVSRQIDQLFHYYNPLLSAKPIESFLVGWDFPTNPAQLLGPSVSAFASGTNSSNYVWDQTIAFQTANSGVSFSRASTGALRVTGAATGQFALVQYVDAPTAIEILNQRLSVNVAADTNIVDGLLGTVSIWYTTGAAPAIGSNLSIVATLDANGYPVTQNGTWVEVPRSSLGNAQFTVMPSATENFNDYSFNGWDLQGATALTSATFVAIVVGFSSMISTNTVDFASISLVPGDIPTRPAPKTADEVISQCQRFYEKSYALATVVGTATLVNAMTAPMQATLLYSGNVVNFIGQTFSLNFYERKRVTTPTVTIYSSNSGSSGNVYATVEYTDPFNTPNGFSASSDLAITKWGTATVGDRSVVYILPKNSLFFTPSVSVPSGSNTDVPGSAFITFHYLIDARIGVV